MASARVERRLAAILAADVVGYCSLMERDDDRTLAQLKALRRELVDISEYQGRVVKLMATARWSSSRAWSTRCAARC